MAASVGAIGISRILRADSARVREWASVNPVTVINTRFKDPAIKQRQARKSKWSIPDKICSTPNTK